MHAVSVYDGCMCTYKQYITMERVFWTVEIALMEGTFAVNRQLIMIIKRHVNDKNGFEAQQKLYQLCFFAYFRDIAGYSKCL